MWRTLSACRVGARAEALWTAVDHYIAGHLIPADPALEAALRANEAANLPAIDVAPNQGKLLYLLARMQGAKRILEIGAIGGYSAIWLAKALPPDGRIVTLEVNPKHAAVASANLSAAGLGSQVDLRVGPALESLAKLEAEKAEPFDFIFIDADKPNNTAYLHWALRFSRAGTLIVVDNVVRDGDVINPHSTDPSVQGSRQLFEALVAEGRIEATALQTVGQKGYDGFVLARVK